MYEHNHRPNIGQPLQAPPEPTTNKRREIISTLAIIIIAPLIALLLTIFVFQSYEVDGPSMESTLHDNDRLLVDKVPRTWSKITRHTYIPNRYDIVIFNHNDVNSVGERQLIKRVIGVPGDRIVINDGIVTIYNQQSPDGFNVDQAGPEAGVIKRTLGSTDLTIKENQLFLMGDNRGNSLDSRSFGPVDADDIVGKLSVRIYPFSQITKF